MQLKIVNNYFSVFDSKFNFKKLIERDMGVEISIEKKIQ